MFTSTVKLLPETTDWVAGFATIVAVRPEDGVGVGVVVAKSICAIASGKTTLPQSQWEMKKEPRVGE